MSSYGGRREFTLSVHIFAWIGLWLRQTEHTRDTDIPYRLTRSCGDCKSFEVTTTTYPIETLGLVASLLAATLDQGHLDGKHKLRNIAIAPAIYILFIQMLLHTNGKFRMGKFRSSLLSQCFVLIRPSLSMSRCRSRYEADIYIYIWGTVSLYFKLNGLDAINKITKFWIILRKDIIYIAERQMKGSA